MSLGFGFSFPAYDQYGAGAGTGPFNQTGVTLDLVFAGVATTPIVDGPTITLGFTNQTYQVAAQYVVWVDGQGLVQKNFGDIVTFSRNSTGTYFDATGTLQSATTNVARFDYNPTTLAAQGLLLEEARTNSIRNNTMVGAVAGTPGTLPTTWTTQLNGLTQTVVGTGTVNGVSYIDIRFNGTTSSAGTLQIKPDGNASGNITATASQVWASSSWVSIVGGSTTNTTAQRLLINEYSAGPTYLRTAVAATNILAGGAAFNRVSGAFTTGASTTILEPIIGLDHASGVAIDITLRIGLPQLELGAFATSVIQTSTIALTRAADVASVNTLSPWYNASEGTLYAEGSRIAAGLTSGVMAGFSQTGAFNQSIYMSNDSGTGNGLNMNVIDGGVAQASVGGTVATGITNTFKAALAYAANNFAGSINGATPVTDVSGTVPTPMQVFALGSSPWQVNGATNWSGYLRRITYFPRRANNADLQILTT